MFSVHKLKIQKLVQEMESAMMMSRDNLEWARVNLVLINWKRKVDKAQPLLQQDMELLLVPKTLLNNLKGLTKK